MKKILILSHGMFCRHLIETAEMIVGVMEDAEALPLLPGVSGADYAGQLEGRIVEFVESGYEVICLADLFGGTPCNSAALLMKKYPLVLISGVNLPMLLQVYIDKEGKGVTELRQVALSSLFEGGVDVGAKLGF